MRTLDLLNTVEKLIQSVDVPQEEYDSAVSIVNWILYNQGIKHLDWTEIFNTLILKLFEKRLSYQFNLTVYQRWNYINKYLIKAMQEIVRWAYNIIDIPLNIIEWGNYARDYYELNPYKCYIEDHEELVEDQYLLKYLYSRMTPKEKFIIQRRFIDWVENKAVARELKISPIKSCRMVKRIKNNVLSSIWNRY